MLLIRSVDLALAAIFKGSPYMPTAVRRDAIAIRRYGANSAYSGLLSTRTDSDSSLSMVESNFLLNSAILELPSGVMFPTRLRIYTKGTQQALHNQDPSRNFQRPFPIDVFTHSRHFD